MKWNGSIHDPSETIIEHSLDHSARFRNDLHYFCVSLIKLFARKSLISFFCIKFAVIIDNVYNNFF